PKQRDENTTVEKEEKYRFSYNDQRHNAAAIPDVFCNTTGCCIQDYGKGTPGRVVRGNRFPALGTLSNANLQQLAAIRAFNKRCKSEAYSPAPSRVFSRGVAPK